MISLQSGSNSPVAMTYNTVYLCITMNFQKPRSSYTSLTFTTIIPIPVCLYLPVFQCEFRPFSPPVTISQSTLDRAELEESAGYWQLWVISAHAHFLFSVFHWPLSTFTEKIAGRLSLELKDTNGFFLLQKLHT